MDTLTRGGGAAGAAGSFAPPGAGGKPTSREWRQIFQLLDKIQKGPDTIAKDPNVRARLDIPSVGEGRPSQNPSTLHTIQQIIELLPKRPPDEEFPIPRSRPFLEDGGRPL